MPRGGHTGTRVALAVPPGLYQQVSDWADAEGRPVAALCMALVEQGIRQAQADGLIPGPSETLREHFERLEEERKTEKEAPYEDILHGVSTSSSEEEKKAALAAILSQMSGES
jgi:hypothetical protein